MKKFLCIMLCLFFLPIPLLATEPLDLGNATLDDLVFWRDQIDQQIAVLSPYASLEKGNEGDDVVTLQLRLISLNYLDGKADGKYGSGTAKAVSLFQCDNGLEESGQADSETLAMLYAENAAVRVTPTPKPTATPQPTATPVPDNAALEITKVSLFQSYGYKKFRIEAKNHSKETIDAFDLVAKAYNRYGTTLYWYGITSGGKTKGFTEQECNIKPGHKYTMGSTYWDLFGWDNATDIEVAVARYHTKDGRTIDIPAKDYVWKSGTLK